MERLTNSGVDARNNVKCLVRDSTCGQAKILPHWILFGISDLVLWISALGAYTWESESQNKVMLTTVGRERQPLHFYLYVCLFAFNSWLFPSGRHPSRQRPFFQHP